ncbi:MAG: GNAT family N-acetyltransferase [Acetobacteraceae bacterium]
MTRSVSAEIEPLHVDCDVSRFSCGKPALDTWLRSRALRNQQTGDSRTFVLCEDRRVVAFYALTAACAARVSLTGALRRNAPDPVPLMLLGQLAVVGSHQGKGLGSRLLRDALMRVARASRHVGFRALATHPIDDEAQGFYARYGFTVVPDSQPRLMVLPLLRLLAALQAARRK